MRHNFTDVESALFNLDVVRLNRAHQANSIKLYKTLSLMGHSYAVWGVLSGSNETKYYNCYHYAQIMKLFLRELLFFIIYGLKRQDHKQSKKAIDLQMN